MLCQKLISAKTKNYWKLSASYAKVGNIFPKKENYHKFKKLMDPWVTKVIAKSSKRNKNFTKNISKNVSPTIKKSIIFFLSLFKKI